MDEEIEFILETAGRYLSRPPTRADVLAVYVGLRPLVKRGRGKDILAFARSRDSCGYVGTADNHRREMDDVSAHGGGLRGSCDHAGQTARMRSASTKNLRIHGYMDDCGGVGRPCRCTVRMLRRSGRWRESRRLGCAACILICRTLPRRWCGRRAGDGADSGRRAGAADAGAVSECTGGDAMAEPVARLLALRTGAR